MYDVLNLEEGAYGIGNEDDGDDSDKESEPSPKSSPAPPESRRKVKAEKEEEQAKKSAVKELPQKTNIPKDLPRPKNAPLRTPASPAARAPGPIPTEPVPLPQKYAAAAAVHIAQSKLEPAKPSSQTKALIEVPAAAPLQGSPTPKQKILKLPDSAPVTASVAKSRPLAGVVQEIPKSEKKLAEIPETHYAPPLSDLVASFQSAKQKCTLLLIKLLSKIQSIT